MALYCYLLSFTIRRKQISSTATSKTGKAFKTTFIVVTAFLVCIGPFVILIFWSALKGSESIPDWYIEFEHVACSANSVINPFIYVYTNNTFKKFCFDVFQQFRRNLYLSKSNKVDIRQSNSKNSTVAKNKKRVKDRETINFQHSGLSVSRIESHASAMDMETSVEDP